MAAQGKLRLITTITNNVKHLLNLIVCQAKKKKEERKKLLPGHISQDIIEKKARSAHYI